MVGSGLERTTSLVVLALSGCAILLLVGQVLDPPALWQTIWAKSRFQLLGQHSFPALPVRRTWRSSTVVEAKRGNCADITRTVSKVALLFLVKGPVFHERVWAEWLDTAAGLVPVEHLARVKLAAVRAGAGPAGPSAKELLCPGMPKQSSPLLTRRSRQKQRGPGKAQLSSLRASTRQRQHLFTLYTHPKPSFEGYSNDSTFAGTEVADRVETSWGSWDLVAASRVLLRAALRDPLNARFQLLCESTLPMYPAPVVYRELMRKPGSNVNTCYPLSSNDSRTLGQVRWPSGFSDRKWYKTGQFFMLTRPDAQVVVDDQTIAAFYKQHWEALRTIYGVFPDESFFSNVLVHYGRANGTSCAGGSVGTAWAADETHPKHPLSFGAEVATPEGLEVLRRLTKQSCDLHEKLREAQQTFVRQNAIRGTHIAALQAAAAGEQSLSRLFQVEQQLVAADRQACTSYCCMFFRKFLPEAREVAWESMHQLRQSQGDFGAELIQLEGPSGPLESILGLHSVRTP